LNSGRAERNLSWTARHDAPVLPLNQAPFHPLAGDHPGHPLRRFPDHGKHTARQKRNRGSCSLYVTSCQVFRSVRGITTTALPCGRTELQIEAGCTPPEKTMSTCHSHSRFSVALAAMALACGADDPVSNPTRTLEITVVTSGDEPDTDGYTVQIDAEPARPVGSAEVLQHSDISPGDHTVYVGGVAENCNVQGANPRTVSVPAEGTTNITIEVVYGVRGGSVLVALRTQGFAPYPSAYTVAIDGGEAAAVDTGRVLFSRIPPGQHLIQLRGLAEPCTTQGNPRTVSVRAVEVTQVEFFIICPGGRGILEITTSPLGYQNPGDFAFRVDEGRAMRLPSGATLSLAVNPGNHAVELMQIPPNCRVLGPNPRPVHIPAGGQRRVNFTIHCDPFAPGSLHVSVVTSGSAPDPDGYQLLLNGDTRYQLRARDRLVIPGLSPGNHLIVLTGLSGNCRVDGENLRTVFVPVGGVAEEHYVVGCSS
jgi:hypothetical protein